MQTAARWHPRTLLLSAVVLLVIGLVYVGVVLGALLLGPTRSVAVLLALPVLAGAGVGLRRWWRSLD